MTLSNNVYQAKNSRIEKRISIRGVNYCINEWGDAESPLIVFLHGWADTGSTFQFVVDALLEDWFVVAPDWRGFGRSRIACESYWFPDYLADLHEILKIYAPDRPVKLIGHSMGANIAALYAGAFPECVERFVNVEGFGLPNSDPADAPSRYRKWISVAASPPGFISYDSFRSLAQRILKRSPGMTPDRAEFVAREWAEERADGRVHLRADPRHKLPNAVLYRRAEAEACWRQIAAEILLVMGSESPFKERFESIDELPFPQSESVAIDGTGHMIHFEAPAHLANAVERFLIKPL